jgi:superfamily II DNA or RNA helicase
MIEYKIIKKGRYGFIDPIPEGKLRIMLDRKMFYVKQGIEFMINPVWGEIHMYNRKLGKFPWGFQRKVRTIFESWKKYSRDNFIMFEPQLYNMEILAMKDESLRKYQCEAVKEFCGGEDGIICVPTGGGKTRIGIEIIKQLNVKTLIVVHTRDLVRQWSAIIPDNAEVRTYQGIKDNKILRDYGLVIFDECHHVSSKSLYNVAMKSLNARLLGLSATPYRTDGEDMRIEASLGKIIFNIKRKELIDLGFLSNAKIFYHEIKKDNYMYKT